MFSFYINKFKVKNLVLNPKNSNKSFKKILKHFKRSAAIGHIRILGVGLEYENGIFAVTLHHKI